MAKAKAKKGLFAEYKHIIVGRVIVERGGPKRRGVVSGCPLKLCSANAFAPNPTYLVRWEGMPTLAPSLALPWEQVKPMLKDKFANVPYVPSAILDLQENKWRHLTQSFKRLRGPHMAEPLPDSLLPPVGANPILSPITGRLLPAELCCGPEDYMLGEVEDYKADEYTVECILDELMSRSGVQYLVKWQDYQVDVGTVGGGKGHWEPAESLKDTEALELWTTERPAWWLAQQASA